MNGVAERNNRTLIETVRTMLTDLELPVTFWSEVVSNAFYTMNKVLVIKRHGKRCYELLLKRKPNIKHVTPQNSIGVDREGPSHGGDTNNDDLKAKIEAALESYSAVLPGRWISDVEGCFRVNKCPPDKKTRLATSLLRGAAKTWLDDKLFMMGEGPFMSMSWDYFKTEFFLEYRTQADLTCIQNELRNLRQGSMELITLKATFLAKVLFCPEYNGNDRMLMEFFHKTLNDDMRWKISLGYVKSFSELVNVAKGFESDVSKVSDVSFNKRKFEASSALGKKEKSGAESTFLVNSKTAKVLFDSGADMSYVSLKYAATLDCPLCDLDSPLQVKIADGMFSVANGVYKNCVIDFGTEKFDVDLVPINLGEFDVVVRMGWLDHNKANLDCHEKFIRVRTPSEGELIMYGEAQKRLVPPSIKSIPIVNESKDVFPNELLGVPPVRQVEFRIELVPGANPIAKIPKSFGTNRDARVVEPNPRVV
ncbi:uncharacterized protein [Rutidosis leptorrhynchoides]|uniref:uncharacterized protein n=1 Tax=Rutidosis leptorrhynchoides TaxID=125765 RepID=UPI003A9916B9